MKERGTFTTNHFDGQSIYTWNIDGKAEHELLSTLQEMTMAMTAYRTKGLDSRIQAIDIINGFQGQLKYWWDNFLTNEEHNRILDYKRVVRNSNNVEVEEPAAAALLIHTITLHFLGNPKEDQASVNPFLLI